MYLSRTMILVRDPQAQGKRKKKKIRERKVIKKRKERPPRVNGKESAIKTVVSASFH